MLRCRQLVEFGQHRNGVVDNPDARRLRRLPATLSRLHRLAFRHLFARALTELEVDLVRVEADLVELLLAVKAFRRVDVVGERVADVANIVVVHAPTLPVGRVREGGWWHDVR